LKNRSRTRAAFHFADVALSNHRIKDRSSTSISDPQVTLEQGCGCTFCLDNTAKSIEEKRIAATWEIIGIVKLLFSSGDGGIVFGPSLCLYVIDDLLNLFFIDKRPVYSDKLRIARGQEKHIAFAKQTLSSVRIDNGTRIDL
jgi:hypothetical protein